MQPTSPGLLHSPSSSTASSSSSAVLSAATSPEPENTSLRKQNLVAVNSDGAAPSIEEREYVDASSGSSCAVQELKKAQLVPLEDITTCTISQIRQTIKGKNDKTAALEEIKTFLAITLQGYAGKDANINELNEIKKAILLAITVIQDNMNHQGTAYFKSQKEYQQIQSPAAIEIFNNLVDPNGLKSALETVCCYEFAPLGDVKWTFFTKQNFTNTAEALSTFVKKENFRSYDTGTYYREIFKNFETLKPTSQTQLVPRADQQIAILPKYIAEGSTLADGKLQISQYANGTPAPKAVCLEEEEEIKGRFFSCSQQNEPAAIGSSSSAPPINQVSKNTFSSIVTRGGNIHFIRASSQNEGGSYSSPGSGFGKNCTDNRYYFDDVTVDESKSENRGTPQCQKYRDGRKDLLITPYQVRRILNDMKTAAERADAVAFCCKAGASRSAAMASAYAALTGNKTLFDSINGFEGKMAGNSTPNQLVYRLLMSEASRQGYYIPAWAITTPLRGSTNWVETRDRLQKISSSSLSHAKMGNSE